MFISTCESSFHGGVAARRSCCPKYSAYASGHLEQRQGRPHNATARLHGALLVQSTAATLEQSASKEATIKAIVQNASHVSTGWRLGVNNLVAYFERDIASSISLGAQSGMATNQNPPPGSASHSDRVYVQHARRVFRHKLKALEQNHRDFTLDRRMRFEVMPHIFVSRR